MNILEILALYQMCFRLYQILHSGLVLRLLKIGAKVPFWVILGLNESINCGNINMQLVTLYELFFLLTGCPIGYEQHTGLTKYSTARIVALSTSKNWQ